MSASSLGQAISAAIADAQARAAVYADELHAHRTGMVLPDGRPVTRHSIGELMAEYADEIAAACVSDGGAA